VPKTLESYGAGLLRFHQFCDQESIPENRRMPASHILLSAFISEWCGKKSGKTIRNWLGGIRLWHLFNHAEWFGDDDWVLSLKKTADKAGVIFSRPPRNPVTPAHLHSLRNSIDLSNPLHATVWAVATAAFWGCRRLGELIIKSSSDFDLFQTVCLDAHIHFSSQNDREVISISLPWTKSTGIRGGLLIITETADLICPVAAFKNHIAVNKLTLSKSGSSIPLFSFLSSSTLSPLTKSLFFSITSSAFSQTGLDPVHGHSYRIGGTVHLLMQGVQPEIIAKLGGWSSLCFLIYWRRLEQVIPLQISRAWDTRIREFASSHNLNHNTSFLDV
jgi:hypothetical protein